MRMTLRCLSKLVSQTTAKLLDQYSQFHPSVLSIQQFIDFGTKNKSENQAFTFLRKEVPVRLANIMKEIDLLPEPLRCQPSVKLLTSWYEQSFLEVLQFEKANSDDSDVLKRFNNTLDAVRTRNKSVVETMAQGVIEMKDNLSPVDYEILDSRVQYFLDRFYMSRISLRMLIHQHLLLFSDEKAQSKDTNHHIGCIDPKCDVLAIAEDAYENARFLCDQYYDRAPACNFTCYTVKGESADHVTMTYVPSHLYHILFELIKNALRAVVEYHQDATELPKLSCLICRGREDVTVKISDEGGGICRSEIDKLFNYMYSTAPRPPGPDEAQISPLAGYGYGLPLSRLYAKYFNGDLWLNSVDGFGTDAMIYLKVFPCDASELLPVFNKTSSSVYTTSRQVGDWSDNSRASNDPTSSTPRR